MSVSSIPRRTASERTPRDHALDRVFHALSDRTRRAMVTRLSRGPASVSELATPFAMTLPGASKHVRVLEQAGLVERSVEGRVHRCTLSAGALEAADHWIAQQRAFWAGTLEALDRYAKARRRR
jgi:DNA-binding transcriptional ArsR family regulator